MVRSLFDCRWARLMIAILTIALLLAGANCRRSAEDERSARVMPTKDVKEVMDAHVSELMAIPGVTGVAIGAFKDGTPHILVLVVKKNPEHGKRIPREIEGYRVVVKESGVIRAMPEDSSQ